MTSTFQKIRRSTLISIITAGAAVLLVWVAVLCLRNTEAFERVELRIYDLYVRWRCRDEPSPNPLVLIEQREKDITDPNFLDYPLTDGQLSDLLEKIMAASPAVVALDIYRDLPVPKDGSQIDRLNQTLIKYPNIITILNLGSKKDGNIQPPKILLNEPMRSGANDLPVDSGATPFIRRAFLFLDDREGNTHYSLSFFASATYLATREISPEADALHPELMRLGPVTIPQFRSRDGAYTCADARGYQFLLDFRRKLELPSFSLREVMDPAFSMERLRGKIVLLGVRAESVHDDSPSPLQSVHRGIDLHAQAIDQLLDWAQGRSRPMKFWSERTEAIWILLFCFIGLGAGWIFRSPLTSLASTLFIFGLVPMVGWALFSNGTWVPVLAPLAGGISTNALAIILQRFRERQDRQIVMRLFSRHVSSEVAEEIWKKRETIMSGGKIPGQLVEVTVLMTDIADYSTISEKMTPPALFDWLDEYMVALSGVVAEHSGIVNKYIGDAIFAVFGIPIPRSNIEEKSLDAIRAVQCALHMRKCLEELNQGWTSRGIPPITMRIGIYSGPVICGSFGGTETMEYGLIGDTVNTASRLESFDKQMMEPGEICRILVGESTWALCRDQFVGKPIGQIKLKGKSETPKVYSIIGQM